METTIISENISSIDFSMLSLFLKADFVVKSVIIILVIASVWSWKIIIEKLIIIKRLKQLESEFDEIFWSGNSFDDLYETFNFNTNDPKSKIFCAAIAEWKKTDNFTGKMKELNINSLKERMNRSMQVIFNKESETYLTCCGRTDSREISAFRPMVQFSFMCAFIFSNNLLNYSKFPQIP